MIHSNLHFLLIVLFVFFGKLSFSQYQSVDFYKDAGCTKSVPEKKANFSKSTSDINGIRTFEVYDLKLEKVVSRTSYKDKEPVGIWIQQGQLSGSELNYNFEVIYSGKSADDNSVLYANKILPEAENESLKNISNLAQNCDSLNYKAPVFGSGDFTTNILTHFIKNMRYPEWARENGVQGTVYVYFEVTETGIIEQIQIKRGVHITLDKEVVRVLKLTPSIQAATKDGIPQRTNFTIPIKFSLR